MPITQTACSHHAARLPNHVYAPAAHRVSQPDCERKLMVHHRAKRSMMPHICQCTNTHLKQPKTILPCVQDLASSVSIQSGHAVMLMGILTSNTSKHQLYGPDAGSHSSAAAHKPKNISCHGSPCCTTLTPTAGDTATAGHDDVQERP